MVELFPFAEYWWFYCGFTGFVLLLLALDLGVFGPVARKLRYHLIGSVSLSKKNFLLHHPRLLSECEFPLSARTGNFPWFWGVYRRVFTHFRLILPVQNVKREKLCLPNVHY
jgi:hypothetical protein